MSHDMLRCVTLCRVTCEGGARRDIVPTEPPCALFLVYFLTGPVQAWANWTVALRPAEAN